MGAAAAGTGKRGLFLGCRRAMHTGQDDKPFVTIWGQTGIKQLFSEVQKWTLCTRVPLLLTVFSKITKATLIASLIADQEGLPLSSLYVPFSSYGERLREIWRFFPFSCKHPPTVVVSPYEQNSALELLSCCKGLTLSCQKGAIRLWTEEGWRKAPFRN